MNSAVAGPHNSRHGRSATLISRSSWVIVLTVATTLVAVTAFESRDPDSTVYSEISARLSLLPFGRWLAPEWWGSWGLSGPFREHPIGILVLPALLARWGYPGAQAAFAIGVLYSVAALWMVRRLMAPLVHEHEAVAAQWAALILPIAFVYRVRASQEYPTLLLTLCALYATHRSRQRPGWIIGIVGAACALALVKGIFVIFLPVVCALWIWWLPDADATRRRGTRSDAAAWTGIALAVVVVLLGAWAYELAYRRVTGDSFFAYYLRGRVGENAGWMEPSFSVLAKLYNVVWYSARVLWFAMPGSVVLVLSAKRLALASVDARRAISFALLAAAVYVVAMSVGANKADRFIFPAYFFVGTLGAVVAMRRWRAVDQLGRRLAALPPYTLPLVWLGLFMLALASEHRLPRIKLWTS